MQAKLDEILRLSREIVFDYGMKQKEIYKAITKHLLDSSTKSTYVAYNDCYGGFSLSDQFSEFVNARHDAILSYRKYASHDNIIAFGKMLCDKYPKVSSMLNIYHKHNLEHQTSQCITYNTYQQHQAKMKKNLETLMSLPRDMRIHTTDVLKGLVYACMYRMVTVAEDKNGKYTVQQLLDELQIEIDETIEDMEDMYPTLNLSILNALKHESIKDSNTEKTSYSFLTAIEKYGESDNVIWDYQSHVRGTAMKCLLLMNDTFVDDEPLDEYVYELFGLMGASGRYACLKFAKVPAELSWTISEYDGLESVRVE